MQVYISIHKAQRWQGLRSRGLKKELTTDLFPQKHLFLWGPGTYSPGCMHVFPFLHFAEWLTCSSNWGFLRDFQISPMNDKVGATFGGKMCCHSGSTLMSFDVTKPDPSRNG